MYYVNKLNEYITVAKPYLYDSYKSILSYWNYPKPRIIEESDVGNIYVITDPISANLSIYKVGITTRSKGELLRDYKRSRPEIHAELFLENVYNYKVIERRVLNNFHEKRVATQSGRKSEWIKCNLQEILDYISHLTSGDLIIEEFYYVPGILSDEGLLSYIRKFYIIDLSIFTVINIDDIYTHYLSNNISKDIYSKQQFCKNIIKYISTYLNISKDEVKMKSQIVSYKYIKLKNLKTIK